ncbi:sugar phosphate isomerase/epimerase family protein [Galactobacter valiniphilus]|uniref:sugar phosphate isomerase/epimerase family protein n=1 Tax=Galactobacter valiniphilus TaxID=2676122 RepID=UPI001F25F285|nr:sugar phosphate isomerase/epimerase [Galactobacter valiniphilus]
MNARLDPPQEPLGPIPVALSTSSVYPLGPDHAFAVAKDLGYDGVEVMVTGNSLSRDGDQLHALVQRFGIPVTAIHAPTLLLTQQVWGGAWTKIQRSALLAHELGCDVVVVHPPFRWQGKYASGFEEGVRRANETYGVKIAVENMYRWRTSGNGREMYLPHWDPVPMDYEYVTWDFSHAAIGRVNSLEAVQALGERLTHVHLTDGNDSGTDEHLPPGRGTQPVAETLQFLAASGFTGGVAAEVSTRRYRKVPGELERVLGETLEFARTHLQRPAADQD